MKMKLVLSAVLISGMLYAHETRADEPAAAEAKPAAAAPAAATAPVANTGAHATGSAGLGLSPNTPQIGAGANITEKQAEALAPTTATAGSDEWKFDFHGYMRGPARLSWGPPTPTAPDANAGPGFTPADAPRGTQIHSWPRNPGLNYTSWDYTNTVPGPWAQLNFSYGNSRAMMTVIVDSYSQTSSGYRNLQAQQGIDQAFITLNFPEAFGDHGGLVWNIGSFQNRYGTAGKYDGGMYETYLFGRTHVAGETLTANLDVSSDWTLSIEQGNGAKIEIAPFMNNQLFQVFKGGAYGSGNTGTISAGPLPAANQGFAYPRNLSDRDAEYLPYAGPVPQGSTFLTHLHAGLAYKKLLTFGAHLLYSWTPDDNWDQTNSSQPNVSDHTVRGGLGSSTAGVGKPVKGSMTILGADVRLNGGVLGDGYFGFSHIDAESIAPLADSIEVLHSFGGWQFKNNYFGRTFNPHTGAYAGPQNETGKIDTFLLQYTFSVGSLLRYPAAFWGDGPDIAITAFAMLNLVNSPSPDPASPQWNIKTKKLKAGLDVAYTPLSWIGLGGRFDMVQPDLDGHLGMDGYGRNLGGSDLSFAVFSPRVVIKTQFVTHEAVTIMYQHYFLHDGATPVYPYEWVPKADANAMSIAGTMWW